MNDLRHRPLASALAAFLFVFAGAGLARAAEIANVASTASAVRKVSDVPVRIPTSLPDSIVGGGGIRANLLSASASAYAVTLTAGAGCRRTACRFGAMRGSRAPTSRLAGEAVTLRGIGPAYFEPAVCSAGCSDATLSWNESRFRYVLGLRGASLNSLRFTAASIRTGRP